MVPFEILFWTAIFITIAALIGAVLLIYAARRLR